MIEIINSKPKCEEKMIDNIRKEYTHAILDLFEDLLDEKEIDIPSDDREGDESEARLYGSEYYDMEDKVDTLLGNYERNVLDTYNIQIKTDLTKDELVKILIDDLGHPDRNIELLTNYIPVGNRMYIMGGVMSHDAENKWSLCHFYVPNNGIPTKK